MLAIAMRMVRGMGCVRLRVAGALLAGTGLLLELALRKPGSLAYRVTAAVIGLAAIAFGESDDAPGLVLFGLLLVVGAVALMVRTALRSE